MPELAQAQGANTAISVALETDFKAGATSGGQLLPYVSEGLKFSRGLNESKTITATRDPSKPSRGRGEVGGDKSTEFDAYSHLLLRALMGSRTTVPATAVQTTAQAVVNALSINLGKRRIANVAGTALGSFASSSLSFGGTGNLSTFTEIASGNPVAGEFKVNYELGVVTLGSAPTGTNTATFKSIPCYIHTFKPAKVLESLIFEKNFSDISEYFQYLGCKMGSLKLDLKDDGFINAAWMIMGAKETNGSTSAFGVNPLVVFPSAKFDGQGITIKVDDVASETCTGFNVSYDNQLDGSVYVLNAARAGERASIPVGKIKLDGTFNALFDSIAIYNKARAATPVRFEALLGSGDSSGSEGNESCSILLPETLLKPDAPTVKSPNGILYELTWQGFLDRAPEAASMIMTVKNGSNVY